MRQSQLPHESMFILTTARNLNVYFVSMQCARCFVLIKTFISMLEFAFWTVAFFEQWPQGSLVSRRIVWLPYGLIFSLLLTVIKIKLNNYQTLHSPFLFLCTPSQIILKQRGDRAVSAPWTDSLQLLILKKMKIKLRS